MVGALCTISRHTSPHFPGRSGRRVSHPLLLGHPLAHKSSRLSIPATLQEKRAHDVKCNFEFYACMIVIWQATSRLVWHFQSVSDLTWRKAAGTWKAMKWIGLSSRTVKSYTLTEIWMMSQMTSWQGISYVLYDYWCEFFSFLSSHPDNFPEKILYSFNTFLSVINLPSCQSTIL